MIINLNDRSHSHDVLDIVQFNNLCCVRKVFHSDIERAIKNVGKQQAFRTLFTGSVRISAADVLKFTVIEDRAELYMPYVEGITGNMFPVHASRAVAHALSASLSTMLYSQLNESTEQIVPTSIFTEKLNDVARATKDESLKEAVLKARELVSLLPESYIFPLGSCHGDLTLSNIIFDPALGITLIDFLDTYLESPLQDVAKLKQDYTYGWSFRSDNGSLKIKADIMCRYHYPQAILHFERLYPMQVHLMMLLSLARIAPYVRDDTTKRWLLESISHCLETHFL